MRRLCVLFLVLSVALAPACSKKSKSPTAPDDSANSNLGLFGSWAGTLDATQGADHYQFPITLTLQDGSIVYTEDGGEYPSAISSLSDPYITFTVQHLDLVATHTGTRVGNTLSGTMHIPDTPFDVTGTWTVTRSASQQATPFAHRPAPAIGRRSRARPPEAG